MKRSKLNQIQGVLVTAGRTDLAKELIISEVKKYDVFSLRNKKRVKWNKKPMSEQEAKKIIKDLKKATIPSVDLKSIEMLEVRQK